MLDYNTLKIIDTGVTDQGGSGAGIIYAQWNRIQTKLPHQLGISELMLDWSVLSVHVSERVLDFVNGID